MQAQWQSISKFHISSTCLCLSNSINSYKISAVHFDAPFNSWLWRQLGMMSLNQVYLLMAFFFLPMCVSRWSKLQLQERVSPAPPHPDTPTSPTRISRGSSEPWTWNRGLPFIHVYIREPVRHCYRLIQTLLHTLLFLMQCHRYSQCCTHRYTHTLESECMHADKLY